MSRYWMEFIKEPKHLPFGLGVTDENLDKAFMFIRDWFSNSHQPLPDLTKIEVIVDVNVSELRGRKYLPLTQVGIPSNRGLWHPQVAIRS